MVRGAVGRHGHGSSATTTVRRGAGMQPLVAPGTRSAAPRLVARMLTRRTCARTAPGNGESLRGAPPPRLLNGSNSFRCRFQRRGGGRAYYNEISTIEIDRAASPHAQVIALASTRKRGTTCAARAAAAAGRAADRSFFLPRIDRDGPRCPARGRRDVQRRDARGPIRAERGVQWLTPAGVAAAAIALRAQHRAGDDAQRPTKTARPAAVKGRRAG